MTTAGLIFSNIHDSEMQELTNIRTMASVPFGCRYRLIDFPLSNMVNSGITKIGIITHNNYQSLMDHLGTGKDWDLARRSGGIRLLPPFVNTYNPASVNTLYTSRLEALMGVSGFLARCNEDGIVMSDCDGVFNIDLSEVLHAHLEKGADMTIVTRRSLAGETGNPEDTIMVTSDGEGRVTDLATMIQNRAEAEISTNIVVVNRHFLIHLIENAAAHGYTRFYREALARRLGSARIYRYLYDGIFMPIHSMENYFSASMRLLEPEVRDGLFNVNNRPIYTKLRNSPPTIYAKDSSVSNCYVADGCLIEGTVENSIIFRGTRIGKGTVVRNSILFQDSVVGTNVFLNCVVADKNSVIRDGRNLSGHETMPFFIPKNSLI